MSTVSPIISMARNYQQHCCQQKRKSSGTNISFTSDIPAAVKEESLLQTTKKYTNNWLSSLQNLTLDFALDTTSDIGFFSTDHQPIAGLNSELSEDFSNQKYTSN